MVNTSSTFCIYFLLNDVKQISKYITLANKWLNEITEVVAATLDRAEHNQRFTDKFAIKASL